MFHWSHFNNNSNKNDDAVVAFLRSGRDELNPQTASHDLNHERHWRSRISNRHRHESHDGQKYKDEHDGFASPPSLHRPPSRQQHHPLSHEEASFSSAEFGETSNVIGSILAERFKGYQLESLERLNVGENQELNELTAHLEHPTNSCKDCCLLCVIPSFSVCCWICCSNCDPSTDTGHHRRMNRTAPPQYGSIDPFHRAVIIENHNAGYFGNNWIGVIPGLCYSCILMIVLLSLSSTTLFIEESHKTWTLMAGETRQVPLPAIFNRDIQISAHSNDRYGAINVYFLDGDCPPLIGFPIQFQGGPYTLDLGQGDYKYDYFFLNKGSTINLNVHELQGSTMVHLVVGDQVLERLANGDHDYGGGFKYSLVNELATARAPAANNSLKYVHLNFTAVTSDTHIVIYENAGINTGVLTVDYSISMSSFDLHNQRPACSITVITHNDSSTMSMDNCVIQRATHRKCLLVQAINDTDMSANSAESSISVKERRQWIPLSLVSVIPFFLTVIIRGWRNWFKKRKESLYYCSVVERECYTVEHLSNEHDACAVESD